MLKLDWFLFVFIEIAVDRSEVIQKLFLTFSQKILQIYNLFIKTKIAHVNKIASSRFIVGIYDLPPPRPGGAALENRSHQNLYRKLIMLSFKIQIQSQLHTSLVVWQWV